MNEYSKVCVTILKYDCFLNGSNGNNKTSRSLRPNDATRLTLHSRGFHVTFVHTEFNDKRFLRNKGSKSLKSALDFRFETISDRLLLFDCDAMQDIAVLYASMRKTCLARFFKLLTKLNSSAY